MEGIQTWSSYERRRNNDDSLTNAATTSNTAIAISPGINALYVSSSSPDIAPAAATLLRHSGLTANIDSRGSDQIDDDGGGATDSSRKDEEEFRLRFHWMRPHPSLAFSLGEHALTTTTTTATAGAMTDSLDGIKSEKRGKRFRANSNAPAATKHPAVEASKLMEVYRHSQMNKHQLNITSNSEGKDDASDHEEGDYDTFEGATSTAHPINISADDLNSRTHNLSLELPKLRINLASLVEPPLMSSWLPGEDMGISYDSGEEGDDTDE